MMYKDAIDAKWLHFGIDNYFISFLKNELKHSLIIELNTSYKGLDFDVYNFRLFKSYNTRLNDVYNYNDLDYLKYLLNNINIKGISLVASDKSFDYLSDLDNNPLNAKSYLGIICYLIYLRMLFDDSIFYIVVFNKEIKLEIKIFDSIFYILSYWYKKGFLINDYTNKLKRILFYSDVLAVNFLNDKIYVFNNKNYLSNNVINEILPSFNYLNEEKLIRIARNNNIIEHFKILFIYALANLLNYDAYNRIIEDSVCIFLIKKVIKELLDFSDITSDNIFDIEEYTYLDNIYFDSKEIIEELNYIFSEVIIKYQKNKAIDKLVFIPLGIAIIFKLLKLNYVNSEYTKELNNSVSLLIYNNRDLDFCIYIKDKLIEYYNELLNNNILGILYKYQTRYLQNFEKFTKKYIFE